MYSKCFFPFQVYVVGGNKKDTKCLNSMQVEPSRVNAGFRWMSDGPGPNRGCMTLGKRSNLSGPQSANYKVRIM